MNIGLALHQLQAEMCFEECLFWGKVEGKFIIFNWYLMNFINHQINNLHSYCFRLSYWLLFGCWSQLLGSSQFRPKIIFLVHWWLYEIFKVTRGCQRVLNFVWPNIMRVHWWVRQDNCFPSRCFRFRLYWWGPTSKK